MSEITTAPSELIRITGTTLEAACLDDIARSSSK